MDSHYGRDMPANRFGASIGRWVLHSLCGTNTSGRIVATVAAICLSPAYAGAESESDSVGALIQFAQLRVDADPERLGGVVDALKSLDRAAAVAPANARIDAVRDQVLGQISDRLQDALDAGDPARALRLFVVIGNRSEYVALERWRIQANEMLAELDRAAEVSRLLDQAEANMAEKNWTTPEADNAFDNFLDALALDPNNQWAIEGRRRIGDQYANLARQAISDSNLVRASGFLTSLDRVAPEHPQVMSLRGELELATQDAAAAKERQPAAFQSRAAVASPLAPESGPPMDDDDMLWKRVKDDCEQVHEYGTKQPDGRHRKAYIQRRRECSLRAD